MNKFRITNWVNSLFQPNRRRRVSSQRRSQAVSHSAAERLEDRALLTDLVNGLGGPAGFGENSLARNDDGSTGQTDITPALPNGLNFFGTTYNSVYFNNNGNITLNAPQGTFTPSAITGSTSNPLIAAFFADVDTRGSNVTPSPGGTSTGTNLLHYDIDATNNVVTATWDDVGVFAQNTNVLNAFQIQLIDQSAANAPGDFDIRFIYENLEWTVGTASGNTHARAGYSSGNGFDFFELPESGNAAQMLDLVNRSNTGTPGEFIFQVRGGTVMNSPDVSFDVATATIAEDAGSLSLTLNRTGNIANPSAVDFVVGAGSTATVGTDFTLPQTVVFGADEATATVTIPLVNDGVVEPTEILNLELVGAGNADIVDPSIAVITITDDDTVPEISIDDITVSENSGAATFRITLDQAGLTDITVLLSTADDTAISGVDYNSVSTTVTIPTGQTEVTVDVPILDNNVDDSSRSFFANLTTPVNAVILDGQGVGTITDDDPAPTVLITGLSGQVNEGETSVFEVTLSSASSEDIVLTIGTLDGSAVSPVDYTAQTAQVTIPAGTQTATSTFDVSTLLDGVYDGGPETFFVEVLSVDAGAVGSAADTETGVILDLDDQPTVSVVANASSTVTEGQAAGFDVTLSHQSFQDIVVTILPINGIAVGPDDFSIDPVVVTIPAGSLSGPVTIQTVDDDSDEPDETFTAGVASIDSGSAIIGGNAVGTIIDDDEGPTISINDVSVDESSGLAIFAVSLSAASSFEIEVDVHTADNTASVNMDYSPVITKVVFAPGQTLRAVNVPIIDDAADESAEDFFVNLSNPVNASILDDQGVGTIADNDFGPNVLINSVINSVNEGQTASFEIALTHASDQDITVTIGTDDGTATAPEDYNGPSANVTILAGELTSATTFDVHTLTDNLFEGGGSEDFIVRVLGVVAGNPNDTSDTEQGAIVDLDGLPTVDVIANAEAVVIEGDTASFDVTLTHPSFENITVTVAATDGSANSPDDYIATSGQVTIPAGSLSAPFTVQTINDADQELVENYFVEVLTVDTGTASPGNSATGLILESNAPPEISVGDLTVDEVAGEAFVPVTLSTPSTFPVMVTLQTADGSASTPDDYAAVSTMVTFNPGETQIEIPVTIISDDLNEPNETFTLEASSPVNATIADGQGLVTIADDDPIPDVTVRNLSGVVDEGNVINFEVALTELSGQDIVLTIGATDGTAVSPGDYVAPDTQITIPAGSLVATATYDVPAVLDATFEGGAIEDFSVSVVSVDSGTVGALGPANGLIQDVDIVPVVSIETTPTSSVAEGGAAQFDVALSNATTQDVVVMVETAAGTATSPEDFTNTSVEVTIPAGSLSAPFSVQTVNDTRDEFDETFLVRVSGISSGDASIGTSANGTIVDDDDGPDISVDDVEVSEDGGMATFNVTLSEASDMVVEVTVSTLDGTATDGEDYVGNSTTLSFTPGVTSLPFDVEILEDAFGEPTEDYSVNLSAPLNGIIVDGQGVGTIIDNDPAADVMIDDQTVAEDAGTASFTVSLTRVSDEDITLTIGTTDGTATSPSDYSGLNAQVTIPAGDLVATATFDVAIVDTATYELTENFTVGIVSVDAGHVGDTSDTGVGTIVDLNAIPTVSIVAGPLSNATEGDVAEFEVMLDIATFEDITVTVATSDGTANSPEDFFAIPPTQVTILAGLLSAPFTVQTIDDAADEADEDYSVNIQSVDSGAAAQGAGATALILDGDDSPGISISDASVNEGDGQVILQVTLAAPSDLTVSVNVSTADGTAVGGDDYQGVFVPVTFGPGETLSEVAIPILEDQLYELDETIDVTLSNPVNALVADAQGVVTIADNDPVPNVIIDDQTVDEDDGSASFTVSLSSPSGSDVTLTIGTTDGTATSPEDYDGPDTQVTIPAGDLVATATFDVSIVDTISYELTEDFTVGVVSVDSGNVGDVSDTGLGTINDIDPVPHVFIIAGDLANVTEGEVAEFTVSLEYESFEDITVTVVTSDGSAESPDDFSAPPPTQVTIPAGSLSAPFLVQTIDDNTDEGDEDYVVSIISVDAGAAFIGDGDSGAIIDDDDEPSISVTDAVIGEEAGQVMIKVTLSSISALPVSALLETTGGTATDGVDYQGVMAPVVFTPGETIVEIPVTIISDSTDEPDETFTVTVSNPINAEIAAAQSLITIIDDDSAPNVIINEVSGPVDEGDIAVFEVQLSHASSDDITLTIGTTDGTADAPGDYTAQNTQITIPAGDLVASTTFGVTTSYEESFEGTEDFTVSVVSVDAGIVNDATATATGVIMDVDAPPELTIFATPNTIEGSDHGFDLMLNYPSFEDITVTVAALSGTATATADFSGAAIQATIPAGDMSVRFNVATVDDDIDEPDESFAVDFVSLDAGNASFGPVVGRGTIFDNDGPPTISIGDVTVLEGDVAIFDVTLSNESAFPISVDFATVDDSAENGDDYESHAGTVNFNPGETVGTIAVTTLPDGIDELDETFFVNLFAPSNVTVNDGTGEATIADNTAAPDVLISDARGNEGTSISFTVSLSGPSSQETVLTIGTDNGTAVAPDDYTPTTAQITIPAGSTVATTTFDVSLLPDTDNETDETFSVLVISVDAGSANVLGTGTGTIVDLPPATIIDNGDPEYAAIGNWVSVSGNGKGHENDFDYSLAGNGGDVADWQFDITDPGQYLVSVSYRHRSNRATDAPFTVFDGAANLGTISINQSVAADDVLDDGTWFEDLGIYNVSDNTLTVVLSDLADGLVIADAVRIQRVGDLVAGPEIVVEANGQAIQDGTGAVSLGDVSLGDTVTTIVTITNSGSQDLTLDEPISLPAGFNLVSSFGSLTVPTGGTTSFELAADTSSVGSIGGEVSFTNNDADESPFNFQIGANVVSAAFIDDGDPGYSSIGAWTPITGPGKGFQNDFRYSSPGDGSDVSTWTFNVAPGEYKVSASWRAHTNRASNATYNITDGLQSNMAVAVDQRVAPSSTGSDGTAVEELTTVNVFGNTLTVTLSDLADGLVIADAVFVDRVGDVAIAPEINVSAGLNAIADDTGAFDFGSVSVGTPATQTFTVSNSGVTPLTLDPAINVPGGFSLVSGFGSTTLLAGESTTFEVQADTSLPGTVSGEISIGNNDADENPFNFTVQAVVEQFKVIADNSDAGFMTVGSWPTVNRNGFNGGFQYAFKGTGTSVARWVVDLPESGQYRVSATYRQSGNRVTDAGFNVFDGASSLGTTNVNQQVAPNDIFDQGSWFEDLGTFDVVGNQLIIELNNFSTDSDPAHVLMIADAIRVERLGDLP